MSNIQNTQTGLSFNVSLLQSTEAQKEVLQSLSNQRQLSELRPKFMKALDVDKKEVFYRYQLYYFQNITNRDFDGSQNEFQLAEIVAMEEAIYWAEKVADKY